MTSLDEMNGPFTMKVNYLPLYIYFFCCICPRFQMFWVQVGLAFQLTNKTDWTKPDFPVLKPTTIFTISTLCVEFIHRMNDARTHLDASFIYIYI